MLIRLRSISQFEQGIVGVVEQVLYQLDQLLFALLSNRMNYRRKRGISLAFNIEFYDLCLTHETLPNSDYYW